MNLSQILFYKIAPIRPEMVEQGILAYLTPFASLFIRLLHRNFDYIKSAVYLFRASLSAKINTL